MAANEQPGTGAGTTTKLSGWALFAAFVVLVAFALFVVYMIRHVSAQEVKWTRLGWLFASVEAIAFGAAGALFGTTIQRARAENAEAEARKNADAAAKGRALASTLVADAPESPGGAARLEALGSDQRNGEAAVAARHASLARDLFPDLR
jgi:hypothetical protein